MCVFVIAVVHVAILLVERHVDIYLIVMFVPDFGEFGDVGLPLSARFYLGVFCILA